MESPSPPRDEISRFAIASLEDQTRIAIEKQEKILEQLQDYDKAYEDVESLLERLPERTRHPIMVPYGPCAFFPGELVHTGEVVAHLGAGYYAERTAAQAGALVRRRRDVVREKIAACEDGIEMLRQRLNTKHVFEGSGEGEGGFEIQEPVDDGGDGQLASRPADGFETVQRARGGYSREQAQALVEEGRRKAEARARQAGDGATPSGPSVDELFQRLEVGAADATPASTSGAARAAPPKRAIAMPWDGPAARDGNSNTAAPEPQGATMSRVLERLAAGEPAAPDGAAPADQARGEQRRSPQHGMRRGFLGKATPRAQGDGARAPPSPSQAPASPSVPQTAERGGGSAAHAAAPTHSAPFVPSAFTGAVVERGESASAPGGDVAATSGGVREKMARAAMPGPGEAPQPFVPAGGEEEHAKPTPSLFKQRLAGRGRGR